MNEKYYIKRIRHGDYQALDQFIEILYPQVYGFIYHNVQGDIAKYLRQEVFIRFMRALPTYQSERKVLNYLYKISIHVRLTYFKHNKNHISYEDELVEGDENVHEAIWKQFGKEEHDQAIYQLNPSQQDVIILKYFKQYTFVEISAISVLVSSVIIYLSKKQYIWK